MNILQNDKILFTGDSITDAGRDRNDFNSLAGYSKIISDYMQLLYPHLNISVFNRGISGDTTALLLQRIDKDIADTNPSIVSILIGINDVWRRYDSNKPTSVEQFAENYNCLLSKIKKHTFKIIILEPFLLSSDKEKERYREDLDPKINILRKIAHSFNAEYIPLDGIFSKLSIKNGAELYS
ncbi:MAG: SGNH/GDSL hydrolase family protein, partial [Clostridia bacterium]|nr:SGNH/GDSL hydrolase family protein [Clostridia bacterium]